MRLIKMLGITAVLAAAVMALVGAASASAAITVKSCEVLANCKTSSKNTKFNALTSNVTLTGLGGLIEIKNKCHGTVSGEILTVTSASEAEKIDAHITAATFDTCSFAPVDAEKLPWLLLTDSVNFPKGLIDGGQVVLLVGSFIGNCTYAETSTDMVSGKWINGDPSSIELSGTLGLVAGSSFCPTLGDISGSYGLTSVSDPGFAKATNIIIG